MTSTNRMESPGVSGRRGTRRGVLLITILLTLLAMGLTAVQLLGLVTPSEETVKLRNSFIASKGQPGDFNWTPAKVPADYMLEEGNVPAQFKEISLAITAAIPEGSSNFDKSLSIARHLMQAPRRNGGILSNTADTYQQIVTQGTGYCADFTQVFNAIAIASGIPVREWGMAFDGYGGKGHAFNEIYEPALNKWILVDSFNSFYVRDAVGAPLSALEFRSALRNGATDKQLEVVPIVADKFQFKSAQRALDYYTQGIDEFYLTWGNNVFSYDNHPAVQFADSLPRAVEQGVAILVGVHPQIRIMQDQMNNPAAIEHLFFKRTLFIVAMTVLVVLMILLLVQIVLYWRAGKNAVRQDKI